MHFLRLDMGPMSQIPLDGEDSLYIGNIPNVLELINHLDIDKWAVLNCTDDPALDNIEGIDTYRLNQWDGEPYPGRTITRGIRYVVSNLQRKRKVVVCCHAGVSRSPGMVVAYLMYRYLEQRYPHAASPLEVRQEAYNVAVEKVHKARPFIHIHPQIDLSIRQYYGLAPKTAADLDTR